MTRAEILRKAAEIVQVRGLARGVLEDSEGRVCLRGAIGAAKGSWWCGPDDILGPDDYIWSNEEAEGADDVASLLLSEAEACE